MLGPPTVRGGIDRPELPEHDLLRERLAVSPCFFTDFLAEIPLAPEQIQEALWDLVWAGEVTNDAFAPLRAPRLTLARAQKASMQRRGSRAGTRFGSRRGSGAAAQVQGRWALTTSIFRADVDPGLRRRTDAELQLERYGIVTREHVLAEGIPGGFSSLYDSLSSLETLGVCRRGYFVEGLGGAQFALPGAVERLRTQANRAEETPPVVLAATDPAQPYGAALPWPKRRDSAPAATSEGDAPKPSVAAGGDARAKPARAAGAYVVLAGAEPVVYVERGGRGIQVLVERDDARLRPALEALASFVTGDRRHKLSLERVDGEAVVGSDLETLLIEVGFRAGPRKLTLSA
jgi:ATP-dependent Lhr-like helicase